MRILAVAATILSLLGVAGCGGPTNDFEGKVYVAMGDSYTSAPGVATTVDVGCFRSSRNYPALVAKSLGAKLKDVSCGGAATTALVGVQNTSEGPAAPQFDALGDETELVTISIGANDEALFGVILATCVKIVDTDPRGAPCRKDLNSDGPDRALEAIALIQGRLTSALNGIRDRAPNARIVLIGYPQLAPAEGTCKALPLADGDYLYVREIMTALGEATKSAAQDAKTDYIDLLGASDGHDVCAGKDAWINGIGTPTDKAAALHPFANEQAAVADLIVAAL